jgi:hypothetical protein
LCRPLDGVERSIDQLPSFLSAYASIIHELSSVEASVVSYVANILGRFFLVFPSIVDSRRQKNYTALTRLFVVLYTKGVFQQLCDKIGVLWREVQERRVLHVRVLTPACGVCGWMDV